MAWWRAARFGALIRWESGAVPAGEWVALLKQAGMGYLLVDNDSPHAPLSEVADACRRNGIRFGFSYSLAGDAAVPKLGELTAAYHPDILSLVLPREFPPDKQARLEAVVRATTPDVVLGGFESGDYATAAGASEFRPPAGDWEAVSDAAEQSPGEVIRLLARVAARGGNLRLDIAPAADGKIAPHDQDLLRAIGRWMTVNGDSIRGTQRTPITPQAWGESTSRPGALFLHVFHWPPDGKLIVGGLEGDVARARLLAGGAALPARRINLTDVAIALPPAAPDSADSVIALDMIGNFGGESTRLLSPTQDNVLSVFDARAAASTRPDQAVSWPVRVNAETSFEVWARYSTGAPDTRGRLAVEAGKQRIEAAVEPTANDTEPRDLRIGALRLPPGEFTLRVVPTVIQGGESIRLSSLTLKP